MSKLAQALAQAVWARGLTPEEKSRVERETYSRVYPKGGTVFRAGDASEHWIGVIDGLAKMTIVSAEGQATSFVAVGTGAWFGEGTVIRRGPRGYDGVVLRESELAFMPRATEGYSIKDTWDVLGMRATASHDTALEGAVVPDKYIARVEDAAQQGKSSIFINGVDPGFMFERVAALMTNISSDIEFIRLDEYFNMHLTSAELLGAFCFGGTEEQIREHLQRHHQAITGRGLVEAQNVT